MKIADYSGCKYVRGRVVSNQLQQLNRESLDNGVSAVKHTNYKQLTPSSSCCAFCFWCFVVEDDHSFLQLPFPLQYRADNRFSSSVCMFMQMKMMQLEECSIDRDMYIDTISLHSCNQSNSINRSKEYSLSPPESKRALTESLLSN